MLRCCSWIDFTLNNERNTFVVEGLYALKFSFLADDLPSKGKAKKIFSRADSQGDTVKILGGAKLGRIELPLRAVVARQGVAEAIDGEIEAL